MARMQMHFLALAVAVLTCAYPADSHAGIRVGAAQRDITPPIGFEIQHYFRESVGVHDPLYARCLYLEDDAGNNLAIVSLDLIYGGFDTCDQLREEIRERVGVRHALIAFTHSHSSAELGPRGRPLISTDKESKWNDGVLDTVLAIVREAKQRAAPASLRAGRASAQVGFNRRLVDDETGHVYMGVNREDAVVPWVNVLVADSKKTGRPIAVLFEHAAHPVIVPHTSNLISADFPGAAAKRIVEVLGKDVVALFGQGCAGNINGFPLRSTHEKADDAGRKLGDAVLEAMRESEAIASESFSVTYARTELPSYPLPSEASWREMAAANENDPDRMEQLDRVRALLDSGAAPVPRRFDAYAVAFGREWCLTTMPHEMFSQYELWIDRNAPFKHTMTFAYTNGYQGYIAVDEALSMGAKGGYEAGSLPNWGGQVWTEHCGPPAVGCESIVKDTLASLWPESPH